MGLFPITLSKKAVLGLLATVVITGFLPLTGLLPPLLVTISQLSSVGLGLTAGIGLISGLLKIQNENQHHTFDHVINEVQELQAYRHQENDQEHELGHENDDVGNLLYERPIPHTFDDVINQLNELQAYRH